MKSSANPVAEDLAVAEKLERVIERVLEDNENLRRANLDCVDMFNMVRDDYEEAVAEINTLRAEVQRLESEKDREMNECYQRACTDFNVEIKELRRFLCISLADRPYMDDGEASDGSVHPFIDYMRDSVDDIRSKLFTRSLQ